MSTLNTYEVAERTLPLAVPSRSSWMTFIRLCQKRRGAHASRAPHQNLTTKLLQVGWMLQGSSECRKREGQ